MKPSRVTGVGPSSQPSVATMSYPADSKVASTQPTFLVQTDSGVTGSRSAT